MKPVAWMDDHGCLESHLYQWMIDEGGWYPLYTAPRELSDEEILDTYYKVMSEIEPSNWKIDFARAILRKAQEK